MSQVNTALVGYGYWGPNLARNLARLPMSCLAAICDQDAARLAGVSQLYPNARPVRDFQALLGDSTIDAVVIATPAHTHYALVKEALLAGKHVLVEKPLAMKVAEGEDLVAVAARAHKVLMVGHTFEYNPAVHKIRELIKTGQVGEVYYIYSTRVNLGRVQSDLNVLWSIAPHDISILLYLLEAMPLEVSARGASYLKGEVEDVVFVDLLLPNNVLAHIHASWLDPSKVRRMTVVGSQKMIVYDDVADEGKVKVYDKGVYKKRDAAFGEFHYHLHSGDIYIPKIDMTEPLYNECAHFLECVREGKRPLTDGENGLRVVRVLEAAEASLRGHGVPVKLVDKW